MIKKIIALAATTLFSLNASAGYVQYELQYGSPNSGLNGFIIQHDTDQSIAFFALWVNDPVGGYGGQIYPFFGEGEQRIVDATTYFRNNGPTNFAVNDSFGSDHTTRYNISFARSTQGNFSYIASYHADLWTNEPRVVKTGTVVGLASKVAVNPLLANELDSYGGYMPGVTRIVPTYIGPQSVPEPASLALLVLGIAGIACMRGRKSAT